MNSDNEYWCQYIHFDLSIFTNEFNYLRIERINHQCHRCSEMLVCHSVGNLVFGCNDITTHIFDFNWFIFSGYFCIIWIWKFVTWKEILWLFRIDSSNMSKKYFSLLYSLMVEIWAATVAAEEEIRKTFITYTSDFMQKKKPTIWN